MACLEVDVVKQSLLACYVGTCSQKIQSEIIIQIKNW